METSDNDLQIFGSPRFYRSIANRPTISQNSYTVSGWPRILAAAKPLAQPGRLGDPAPSRKAGLIL
jgi:hypothetical protein